MKTFLLSLSIACMATGAAMAQEQAAEPIAATQEQPVQQTSTNTPGQMKLGVGLAFGSEASLDENDGGKGGLGIYVGGEYFFTENISAAPSFTYFFKSKIDFYGAEMSAQASTLDLDGRYYFASSEKVSFYGIAGLSVAFAKVEVDGDDSWMGSESSSDNKAGVNLGAGLVYPLTETLDLNAQLKYNTPMEQLAIQVGVAFPIN